MALSFGVSGGNDHPFESVGLCPGWLALPMQSSGLSNRFPVCQLKTRGSCQVEVARYSKAWVVKERTLC